jgi:hypothetical protein
MTTHILPVTEFSVATQDPHFWTDALRRRDHFPLPETHGRSEVQSNDPPLEPIPDSAVPSDSPTLSPVRLSL